MKRIKNFFKMLLLLRINYLQIILILLTAIMIFLIDFVIFASLGKYIGAMSIDSDFSLVFLEDVFSLNTTILACMIIVAAFVVKLLNVYLIGKVTFNARAELYLLFARCFTSLNRDEIDLYSNDKKLSFLTNMTEFLTHNLIMSSLNLISAISYIILVSSYIIYNISYSNAYAFAAFLVVAIIIIKWLGYRSDILKKQVNAVLDSEASFSNKIVTGNKEIIHYNVGNFALNTAERVSDDVADLKFQSYFLSSVFRPLMEFMGLSLIFTMIFLSDSSFSNNLTALLFLVKAIPSFQAVVAFMVSFKLCEQPINDVVKVIEGKGVSKSNSVAPLKSFQLAGVVVKLEKGALKLRDRNFNVGVNYAFIGPSGSGKSTVLDILAGYRRAEVGALIVDNKKISNAHIQADYAFQDPMIFNGTILENIIFNRTGITQKDTERARDLLKLLELEVPLDQKVVNFGDNLSGGQKARLSLARALFRPCDIILIDECFAQIQKDLSIRIIDRLREIYDCIILIAHDDTIVPNDFIRVQDVGEIYEN